MKIKTKIADFDYVMSLPKQKHIKPKKPNMFFRTLLKVVGISDLKATNFTYKTIGMEKLSKNESAVFLMNHSSFIDLEIATNILYPRPLNIVCTSDGFVGKEWLMRNLGCIPTRKFITDTTLVRDMVYALKKLNSSVLMYPEASYTFDGTATPLPDSLAKCIKLLSCPVVMIKTEGAFLRDPLYNMLQKRKVDVSATVEYILSPEDIKKMEVQEIADILNRNFTFDNFKEQFEKKIKVTEPFRADGLNRVLYKCPSCESEGQMEGKGEHITCKKCNKSWYLTELGSLKATKSEDIFTHIPDWYKWERDCVKKEIESGNYYLDVPVTIRIMVNTKCIYEVGDGRLTQDINGFHLVSDDKKIDYYHNWNLSYSLYSDYFWYELGDVICIGNNKVLYYCFPKTKEDVVAKTRLATEEIYNLKTKKTVVL